MAIKLNIFFYPVINSFLVYKKSFWKRVTSWFSGRGERSIEQHSDQTTQKTHAQSQASQGSSSLENRVPDLEEQLQPSQASCMYEYVLEYNINPLL